MATPSRWSGLAALLLGYAVTEVSAAVMAQRPGLVVRNVASSTAEPRQTPNLSGQVNEAVTTIGPVGAADAPRPTIRVEQRGAVLAGSYDSGEAGNVTFLWHPTSGYLSVSENGTRLGVVQVSFRTRRWTGDDMSLYVLSRLDREVGLIVDLLAEGTVPQPGQPTVQPDVFYPDPGCSPLEDPNCSSGGGGGCFGHYMTVMPIYCFGSCKKLLAQYDPYANYDSGCYEDGDACDGWCRDDDNCTNPWP